MDRTSNLIRDENGLYQEPSYEIDTKLMPRYTFDTWIEMHTIGSARDYEDMDRTPILVREKMAGIIISTSLT